MPSLISNVRRVFADLITEDGFEVAVPHCHPQFVSMVRYVTPDMFAYLFVQDGRPGGGNLDVDMWLAPPDCPDHSIDALVAGYQIRILSVYDVNDDVMAMATTRVKKILPLCSQFAPLVRSNLSDPTYNQRARKSYLMIRRIYESLQDGSDSGWILEESRQVIEANCGVRKTFFSAMEKLSPLLVERIPKIHSEPDAVLRKVIADGVLEMIYVNMLAGKGRARLPEK